MTQLGRKELGFITVRDRISLSASLDEVSAQAESLKDLWDKASSQFD